MKIKISNEKKKNGYILLDALTTVFISAAIVGGIAGGVATVAYAVSSARNKIVLTLEESNGIEKEPRFESSNE